MVLSLLCLSIYHLQKYHVPSFVELSTLPYAVKEKKFISRVHSGFHSQSWIWALAGSSYFGRIVYWTISKAV